MVLRAYNVLVMKLPSPLLTAKVYALLLGTCTEFTVLIQHLLTNLS